MRILSPMVTEWDTKAAGHWDSAIRGSSSLRAQLARSLELELAHAEGLFTAHFLWDIRKFYDSIKLKVLIPRLIDLNYPGVLLSIGLLIHKAPRILLVGEHCGDIINGGARSILAGCQQSASWARGLLYELVQRLGNVMPG